jgi:HK97 family phage portal protein
VGWFSRKPAKDESVQKSGGWTLSDAGAWLLRGLGGTPASSGKRVGLADALTVSSVYACVTYLSADVGKLPVHVYREVKPKGKREVHKRHPLERLLQNPNRYQDRMQFFETLMMGLTMRGNAYVAKIPDGKGGVDRLIPIHPDRVSILEVSDGSLFYRISSAGDFERYQMGEALITIPDTDMIHLRLASLNGIVGLSPIAQARETIGTALAEGEYVGRLLGNGARPAGVLKHPGTLTAEAAKRLKDRWNDIYGGIEQAGKTAVLEEGMEWKPMSMTSVDAEFMAGRKFSVEEIARIWRMPPHMIGDLAKATNNNISDQTAGYYNNTLSAYLTRIELAFAKSFGLGSDEYVEFDTDELLRMDMASRFKAYREARAAFMMTTNEMRAREGLDPDPHPDSDRVLVPKNYGNEGGDGESTGEAQTPAGEAKPGTEND